MREEVRKRSNKLEGSKYRIGQQYPKEVQDKRRELVPIMKREREKGNSAYFTADKLVVNGKVWKNGASMKSK
ncbi:hypothetical protein KUTeg_020538 [Tegillarca granosa]|uniref:Uncharacterized protein n=1 Tax=Tegillarca granosa TaxID=220873 RepID=A0ABQ9E875_TEGGR|nr:hypothetical protein KUTeg_020538 [Tegillarca granosa]